MTDANQATENVDVLDNPGPQTEEAPAVGSGNSEHGQSEPDRYRFPSLADVNLGMTEVDSGVEGVSLHVGQGAGPLPHENAQAAYPANYEAGKSETQTGSEDYQKGFKDGYDAAVAIVESHRTTEPYPEEATEEVVEQSRPQNKSAALGGRRLQRSLDGKS